ncbi:hypothetical protein ACWCQS_38700 [Streptomyces sp. NPDC002076]
MSSAWTCGACGTSNVDRASCDACGTSSPTATAADLVNTALRDAAAARTAQVGEATRGNDRLARHLDSVVDAYLDDAFALQIARHPVIGASTGVLMRGAGALNTPRPGRAPKGIT